MGQALLFGVFQTTSSRTPSFIIFILLLVPWLTVFTISFCRQPPFGPRLFRHCLVFVMSWYSVMTIIAEGRHYLLPPAPHQGAPVIVPQVLIVLGFGGFVVFIRVWRALGRITPEKAKPQA